MEDGCCNEAWSRWVGIVLLRQVPRESEFSFVFDISLLPLLFLGSS